MIQNQIKTAIEFLKDNQPFKIGNIRLSISALNVIEVTGWSQYIYLKNISKSIATEDLKNLKSEFFTILNSSLELQSFIKNKEIKFNLWFNDNNKASIEICSEQYGLISWKPYIK